MESKKEIIWHAPEFKYNHKDISWYWLSIIISSLIFLIALWQKNLLFALFIIIAEVMLIIFAKELPKTRIFKLDHDGLHISSSDHKPLKSFNYNEIQGFHIHERDDSHELILKTKNKIHPCVKILISRKEIPEISGYLKKHVEEVEYEESLADHIEKILRF